MKTKTVTQVILTADEGMYLTDGKTYGTTVVLPDGADPTVWREITEAEKEILKRPFTNELIEKELDIVKRSNRKLIEDIIYVSNAYEALADFAAKVSDGLYEPQYLMCGDDRVDSYERMINSDKPWKLADGREVENILKDSLCNK